MRWLCALGLVACTRENPGLSIAGDDLAVPADLASATDLAMRHDLAVRLDFAAPPDFSSPSDLATLIDLSGTSCVPSSSGATRYVDPVLGSDDDQHGAAPGASANQTLTFALSRAAGTLSLAPAIYAAPSETLPFTLGGVQQLKCNGATLRGAGGSAQATVVLEGSANALDGCAVDGNGAGQICVYVSSTPTGSHAFSNGSVTRCGGTGLYVAGGPTTISGSTVSSVALDGILWYAASGTMTNNSFAGNTRDIDCPNSSSGAITGSGNTRAGGAPVCTGCAHCPF